MPLPSPPPPPLFAPRRASRRSAAYGRRARRSRRCARACSSSRATWRTSGASRPRRRRASATASGKAGRKREGIPRTEQSGSPHRHAASGDSPPDAPAWSGRLRCRHPPRLTPRRPLFAANQAARHAHGRHGRAPARAHAAQLARARGMEKCLVNKVQEEKL